MGQWRGKAITISRTRAQGLGVLGLDIGGTEATNQRDSRIEGRVKGEASF